MNNEFLFHRPRKVTIVESIIDQIVGQIQQGKLNPGDRLPSERQLIEMLSVSRSSVREALQGLIVLGLVESRPGQGTFVSSSQGRILPSLDTLAMTDRLQREMRLHLVEARRAIEGPIARLAAQRATAKGLAVLHRRFEEYARDPFAGPAAPHLASPHTAVHLALAELTGNPFFVNVVDNLLRSVPQPLRSQEQTALDEAAITQTIADEIAMHGAIIGAIERGDADAAFQAMDSHLDYEKRLVMQMFAEQTPAG